MDHSLKKEPFVSLSIKKSVVQKFSSFSRKICRSRSMTLLLMLQFFENNKLSPTEDLGPQMKTLESSLSSRINNLIAILRNIESNEIKPTRGMLEALFEHANQRPEKSMENTLNKAFRELETQPLLPAEAKPDTSLQDIRMLLGRVELVKPTLGKSYFRLSIPAEQIKQLKSKYHVYHQ